MNQNQSNFDAAVIADRFENACNSFNKLIASKNHKPLTAIQEKMATELKTYREDGILRVAFIGQYSAGKSTIISALTGRRDIKIDADIATDSTSNYDWNNIKIIDTPGIFTDRKDHDKITYEAIDKADLLVFCLTYMLFDSLTVENFKKLAYERGYRWKMMLVINKMSDEAGEEAEKIANYRESLTEALKPYSLDEFPVSFIDAKDYCDGVDDEDDFLLEISRFDTFIDELNNFVKRRGSLARFDTPVRIALSCVEESQIHFIRNSEEDEAFFEILNQLSRRTRKERDRLETKIKAVALKLSSEISREGVNLAHDVGEIKSEAEWNQRIERANKNCEKHYQKAEQEIQPIFDSAIEDINEEIKGILEGDFCQAFFAYVKKNQDANTKNAGDGFNAEKFRNKVKFLGNIGEQVGKKVMGSATREFLKTGSKTGFVRSIDVVGSGLHRTVLEVGQSIGFKFKPWQAVRLSKNIANAAKFIGPAVAFAGLAADGMEMKKERDREREMAAIRNNITSQFQSIAKDLENQLEIQRYEFEDRLYGDIEKAISENRQQQENAIASKDVSMQEIAAIRKEFESILALISPQN